jgi:S-sulfo-L-cysteine synthase (3-phospho-L-serine-dependent)
MGPWFVLVESNTTGSGRLFCARARDLGLRPVLLARDPGRYPYLAEDGIDAVPADTADPAALLAACRALDAPVAGVTSSSEYYIATAADLAAALGLPHPDSGAIRSCRDKRTQRERLLAAGVPGPAFAAAATPQQAAAAADRIGYPVVVKPVSGSGSVGARRCSGPAEAAAAAAYVLYTDPAELALPAQPAVLVEEYLPGPEYSAETLDTEVVGITRKHLGPEPYFVETGHDFPAPLDPADRTAMAGTAVAALRALGLGWGGAHVELRRTPARPCIVEVNPRLAGGMIPRMVAESLGVDLIWHVVAKAAGQPRPPRPARPAATAIRFLVAAQAGRLTGVRGLAAARAVPGVAEVGVTARPGQEVLVRHNFRDRLGYVIARGDSGPAAARAAEAALRLLAADLAPAASVTDGTPG